MVLVAKLPTEVLLNLVIAQLRHELSQGQGGQDERSLIDAIADYQTAKLNEPLLQNLLSDGN